ncbi:hypothetical protein [Diplocloster agilis]|uniref:Uncharacterized protein n=1 Tax=Diplocloster agilis TaxID=2850323 RepID=A0A949K6S4_9FIRM|nr:MULTISPECIES: hypothetical protein [Lachnospiraceae]MBU9737278.1 hypothetical protein [Diplocloster agilis]MBU9742213.1 hypothetical protein [Diplocloster agilis]MCU6734365.1 hypothetical protein [Suonthocola fibrivorans]SCJ36460.1 Uncharacterised protein [uncultured Clostridium sp.]
MSQEKVDRYKKEKANRQKILKKQKVERIVLKVVAVVILVAALGWVGFSVYDIVQKRPVETAYVDLSAVDNYMNGLEEEGEN